VILERQFIERNDNASIKQQFIKSNNNFC